MVRGKVKGARELGENGKKVDESRSRVRGAGFILSVQAAGASVYVMTFLAQFSGRNQALGASLIPRVR
jgi:hypothetical protein